MNRNEEKKKKRRRNRGRKRRGLPALTSVKQMDLKEENEEMKAKLADRLSKDKPKSDGGKVEDRLAKLAGIKQMDDENNDATEFTILANYRINSIHRIYSQSHKDVDKMWKEPQR